MSNLTKKDGIGKIIVDIPIKDFDLFKLIVRTRGYTIKEIVWNLIKQFNAGKISIDKNL